jgi:hypothetical protein
LFEEIWTIIDSIFNGQDCFASLPVRYNYGQRHDNILKIENYLLSSGFPAVKINNRIAFKIAKARQ